MSNIYFVNPVYPVYYTPKQVKQRFNLTIKKLNDTWVTVERYLYINGKEIPKLESHIKAFNLAMEKSGRKNLRKLQPSDFTKLWKYHAIFAARQSLKEDHVSNSDIFVIQPEEIYIKFHIPNEIPNYNYTFFVPVNDLIYKTKRKATKKKHTAALVH